MAVVTITDQEVTGQVTGDSPVLTTSTAKVERKYSPSSLGDTLTSDLKQVPLEDVIRIRQLGDVKTETQTPMMTMGNRYLVFLAPTGLRDTPSNEYYITGAVAGLYRVEGQEMRRVVNDGDKLPSVIKDNDLLE